MHKDIVFVSIIGPREQMMQTKGSLKEVGSTMHAYTSEAMTPLTNEIRNP
jgi:hypothetical protein